MLQIQQGLQTLQQEAPGVLPGLSGTPLSPNNNTTSNSTNLTNTIAQNNSSTVTGSNTTTTPAATTGQSMNQTELASLLANMLNVMGANGNECANLTGNLQSGGAGGTIVGCISIYFLILNHND